MGERVSRSLLDPILAPWVPRLYRVMFLPRWLWPEAIVLVGHMLAVAGAFGFAWSVHRWWGGLLAAAGVAGNHLADMVDGTHARATDQCRNGGELLDHFTDPLSFSYWAVGLGVSCGRLDLALAAVIVIYATAVLTNIRAKLTGRFVLARFGPTEFKALLVAWGVALVAAHLLWRQAVVGSMAWWFFVLLVTVGILQLIVNLVRGVVAVNRDGAPPDTSPWRLEANESDPQS